MQCKSFCKSSCKSSTSIYTCRYVIGDSGGDVHCTTASGMIFETEWECPEEVGDEVLAEHPAYPESFAPGVVLEIVDRTADFKVPLLTIEFYNGFVLDLPQVNTEEREAYTLLL